MIKKVVIRNGKKFIVNTPDWNDFGGSDFGVGPGAPAGTAWMLSSDGNWYEVSLTGTSGSATISINQTPLTWQSPGADDAGYQLVYNSDDNQTYQVYLTGNAGAVTINVNPTPWSNPTDFKPFLSLKSEDDNSFYQVVLRGSPGPGLFVDQNSKWVSVQPGLTPFATGSWDRPYSLGW